MSPTLSFVSLFLFFLLPSICGGANRERLVSQLHPVQPLAGHRRHRRVQVLAEAVALGGGRPRVPDEVEGLERPEGAQQLAHLKHHDTTPLNTI